VVHLQPIYIDVLIRLKFVKTIKNYVIDVLIAQENVVKRYERFCYYFCDFYRVQNV